MTHRDRYEPGRWRDDRDDYRSERGAWDREGRDRWFGENEEIARQRRAEPARENSPAAWGRPHSYSSDRDYGDRSYSRPSHEWPNPPDDAPAWREGNAPGWRDERTSPSYTRMSHGHYAEPGYQVSERPAPYGSFERDRGGAREWSAVEGWRVPGPHVGRGPRGYQRSDERIQDELHERLTAHGLIDATDVECRVVNGEVTLAGFVDSRAAKRAAEDLAEDIHGVRQVHNELRIRSHAGDEGVGRTSVLGLTESQVQTPRAAAPDAIERPRTRR